MAHTPSLRLFMPQKKFVFTRNSSSKYRPAGSVAVSISVANYRLSVNSLRFDSAGYQDGILRSLPNTTQPPEPSHPTPPHHRPGPAP